MSEIKGMCAVFLENPKHVLGTSLAQEYPVGLGNQIANVLISASDEIETNNRLHLSGC